jgi:PAP2 superfamily
MSQPKLFAQPGSLVRKGLLLGMITAALLLVGGYLLFVNTRWGQTVDNEAYLERKIVAPSLVKYGSFILSHVSPGSVACGIAFIMIIGAVRRCLPTAAIVATAFAGAIAGAEGLKRTLPWHALVFDDPQLPLGLQGPTYPSGHTTIGTSFAIALILMSSARWRPWIAAGAGIISASFATGVVVLGWHRSSDALGGIFWSAFCMSLASLCAVGWHGNAVSESKYPRATRAGSTLLVTVTATLFWWFAAARNTVPHPTADGPFLILTLLIVFASFAVTTWFGSQLHSIDWRENS